jgi:hypothetical protein
VWGSGDVMLMERQDYDNVTRSRDLELIVQVQDTGDPFNAVNVTLRFVITDSDDNKPCFAQDAYNAGKSSQVKSGQVKSSQVNYEFQTMENVIVW